MKSKLFILSILAFYSCLNSIAQTVNTESILNSVLTDERVQRETEIEKFSRTLNYNLPAVKKLEFRIGINGNNSPDSLDGNLRNEDYYSINLTTNKWKEMKLQKEIKPTQTNLYSRERELVQMQALQERYQLVTNLYYSQEFVDKRKELQQLLIRKNDLLKQLLNDGISIKISDALDVEKDILILYDLLQEDENNLAVNKEKLRQFLNSSSITSFNFTDLISIKKIIENSLLLKRDSLSSHPSLDYKEAQYLFAKANYKLEKVQNTNIINSFQLGYNRPVYTQEVLKKFNPDNTLVFRVGISVPITGNYNLNRNNANLQQYNALLNWKSALVLQDKSVIIQQSRFDNSIKQYNALDDIYSKSIVNKLLENKDVMQQSTALEILDLNIVKKKQEISLINSAYNIRQSYILLLESKGLLKYELRHKYLLQD